jgi:hypothetical protein
MQCKQLLPDSQTTISRCRFHESVQGTLTLCGLTMHRYLNHGCDTNPKGGLHLAPSFANRLLSASAQSVW